MRPMLLASDPLERRHLRELRPIARRSPASVAAPCSRAAAGGAPGRGRRPSRRPGSRATGHGRGQPAARADHRPDPARRDPPRDSRPPRERGGAARRASRRPPRRGGRSRDPTALPLAGTTSTAAPPRPRQSPPVASAASSARSSRSASVPSVASNASPIASQTHVDATHVSPARPVLAAIRLAGRGTQFSPVNCALLPSAASIATCRNSDCTSSARNCAIASSGEGPRPTARGRASRTADP